MFVFKNKYFLIIESIKDLKLKNIKNNNKINIIYRRKNKIIEEIEELKIYRKACRLKNIKFFVANNIYLTILLKADGLYISSYNKSYRHLHLRKLKYLVIGSAHNIREIELKKKQGCTNILLSRFFKVDYDNNSSFMGVIKFNNFLRLSKTLIPLGGIKYTNLSALKNIDCDGIAVMSEIKKKPVIINRLF